MIRDEVIRQYRKAADMSKDTWNVVARAGEYLAEYPEDPLAALLEDMTAYRIPTVLSEQVRCILVAAL